VDFETVFSKEFFQVLVEVVNEGYGWDELNASELEEELHVVQ
jgi:hypothetical protein